MIAQLKALYIVIFYLGIIFTSNAQTLSYSNLGYSTSICNIFNANPLKVIGGLTHHPISGGVSYNGNSLVLQTKGGETPSTTFGTAYALEISIKEGYSYNIIVNASKQSVDPVSAPIIEVGTLISIPNPNTTHPTSCGSVDRNKWSILEGERIDLAYINNSNANNYPVVENYVADADYNYFTILAHSGSTSEYSSVFINSITIIETPPISFTITPSSVEIPCGTSTTQIFTVNNVYNTPGVISYEWNLGSSNNGWLYQNSAAQPTFTTLTNSIELTSLIAPPTLSDVSVTVKIDGINVATLTSDISLSIPNNFYTISGPDQFCTTANYSISNLPTGASVQWNVSSISGLHSKSVSNNVLTLTRVTDGSAKITAVISVCGSTVSPTKTVQHGGNLITVIATQTSCDGVTFNVSGAATGATYNWSSSGNTILYNGTSTTASTLTGQIDAVISGFDVAAVNTTNTCAQSVNVGADYNPYYREIQDLYPEYINGDHISVSVNTTPNDSYYRWYINNTLVKEGEFAYSYCTCYYESPDARVCGENNIRVEVETSCGINSSFEAEFYKICGYLRSQSNVELFPNPARSQVTIRLKEINLTKSTNSLKEIREVRIMNKLGIVRKEFRFSPKSQTISVDVSYLPMDVYFIEVSDGNNTARIPLSIQN